MPILGKKYYDRFGYAYFSGYQAFSCDVEFAIVSKILRKEKIILQTIIQHFNPAYGNANWDSLYLKNNKFLTTDTEILRKRRKIYFGLGKEQLDNSSSKIWSILICTLEERKATFDKISQKLMKQIYDLGLQDKIEILFFCDNRENPVYYKRNSLLNAASGKYTCFIDDDDDVSDDYIKTIYSKLLRDPDCVSLMGIMTIDGKDPKTFIHSIKYHDWFESKGIYYRPPNHLNPIRRIIGVQFVFPNRYPGEDKGWSMQIEESGLAKKEEAINKPYYFYLCSHNKKISPKIVIQERPEYKIERVEKILSVPWQKL